MNKENTKDFLKHINYSIGLDIGTNSVGWAVVDENMNLVKRYKKHLWGSRLFDERQTAAGRRNFRSARRRLVRRRIRLSMLNKIFEPFIDDENFFIRMQESFLQRGDRHLKNKNLLFDDLRPCKNPLNGEDILNDAQFYKAFPTIYHLRYALIQNADKEFDPRLIYLAVHHILKSRGNFINEDISGQDSDETNNKELLKQILLDIAALFDESMEDMDDISPNCWLKQLNDKLDDFLSILENKSSLSKKECLDKIKKEFNKNEEISTLFSLLLGYEVNLRKIFKNCDDEKFKIQLSGENVDSKITELSEYAEFLNDAKNLYSNIEYERVMSGEQYISKLMIERYERYKKQLKDLKTIFLAVYPKQNGNTHSEYRKFFRDLKEENNYARYTYSKNACTEKDFYNTIKNVIYDNEQKIIDAGIITDDNEAVAVKAKKILALILNDSELGKQTIFADTPIDDFDVEKEREKGFLRRPRIAGNGIFPKQSHEKELRKILGNQGAFWRQYLDKETQEKIISLFNFKIDYFVGPLGVRKGDNDFGWVVRNSEYENVPISFENYDKAINFEETRKDFILRMTGNCTYFIGEKALPKNSMIYSYFNVLNELSNISVVIDGKQTRLANLHYDNNTNFFDKIIDRLLETNTYKKKDLENAVSNEYPNTEIIIKGFANGEKLISNLKPIRDMTRIVSKITLSANTIIQYLYSEKAQMCEDIIRDITIFGESKKALIESLKKYDLTKTQIDELSTLKYTGWGNLSKKLICGIQSNDKRLTILELMSQEHKNFISIYVELKYGFKEKVEEELVNCDKKIDEKIDDFACSPSVKRGITQAFKIVEELVKVMGHSPQNVFIEFARGADKNQKGKLSVARQKQINKLYTEAQKISKDLYNQLVINNADLQNNMSKLKNESYKNFFDGEKEVLYFLQAGKCMYTGESLCLDCLSEYEVDHIVPQSLVKDDSFDNKVLVKKEANQKKQDCEVVPQEFKQYELWKGLRTLKLLTEEKYLRLIRNELSDKDKKGFIKRQLVETRQIIKNTAMLLNDFFKSLEADTKVYPVKAELNSLFRKQFGYPKGEGGRLINDFHHAKDAYITTIMGQYMLNKWNLDQTESLHLSGKYYAGKLPKNAENGLILWNLKQEQLNKIQWADNRKITTNVVLDNFDRNYYSMDCYFTKKIDAKSTGAFYKETKFKNKRNSEKWGEDFKSGMVTLGKKGFDKELDPVLYGGYSAIQFSKFAVIQKIGKNKCDYKFISIPSMITCPTSTVTIDEYLKTNYPNYEILKYIPKYSILEEKSLGKMIISGKLDKYCANQLKFSRENKELYKFIYLVVKYLETGSKDKESVVHYEKWVNEKDYPVLPNQQLEYEEKIAIIKEYIIDCVKRFKDEYIKHLKEKHVLKDFAETIERYFSEMLSEEANLGEMLAIIPELLEITQCNAERVNLKKYSTENVKFNGEVGRITKQIKDFENTYIIYNSITGIYSKKEKIIK